MLDIGREKGDPDPGEARESEIAILIKERAEAGRKASAETEGKGPQLRILVLSLFGRLLLGGRTVSLRGGYHRVADRIKGSHPTGPPL